jgi:membrane-bound serine protease (ClpP class)
MTRLTPPRRAGAPKREIVPLFNTTIPDESGGLTPEQIREQVMFQQQRPPSRAPLTEADRDKWQLVTQVVSNDRLLTLKQDEALYYGLAVETIANDDQLKAFFGASSLTRYGATWSEGLVRVLISWPVKILLIITFIICLFVELAAPGVGVFGGTALVALLLLIGAPALAGMAQWWDILLIFVGILLLAMEIFVIPGLGIAGIAGALCLLTGLVGTFVTGDITSAQGQSELLKGIGSTLAALLAAGIGIWFLSRHTGAMPILNRLVLNADVGSRSDPESASASLLEAMDRSPHDAGIAAGDLGTAETDLRPAGRARFNERLVDVQTPGGYIERGRSVRVLNVGRYVIEVEEAV